MTRPTSLPPAVLIGPADLPEFEAAAALLQGRMRCAEFDAPASALAADRLRFPERNASPRRPASDEADVEPLLGVLFEPTPGCWSASEAAALAARWPLCGWTSVYADVCRGDERAGRALPGVRRLPWLRAETAFDLDLWDFSEGRRPRFQRPASYSADDHALADAPLPVPQSEGRAVVAAARHVYEALAARMQACGWTARPLVPHAEPRSSDLLLWDFEAPPMGYDFSHAAARGWSAVWAQGSFLRRADVFELRRRGAQDVFFKPMPLRELGLKLLRFVESRGEASGSSTVCSVPKID